MDTVQLLLAMIRVAICGETPTEELKKACTPENLEKVYTLSARHDLAHLVGQGASKIQLTESPSLEKCKKAAMSAFVRQTQQEYDLQKLYALLEGANICFLPLKGAVLRSFYPEPWQRTSCDIDIMVRKEDMAQATDLLKAEGWKQWEQSSNEITFVSTGNTVLELHHSLLEDHVTMPVEKRLDNLWQYTQPIKGKRCHMELPDQWFYCCHLAHMAKHIAYGGCGIRPFLDLWILDKKMPCRSLPAGSGLEQFEKAAHKLAQCWFSQEPMDEMSRTLQDYILSGGAYGSLKNQVEMQKVKKGGKGKYLMGRIFPPYSEMRGLFPVLQKHRWLTPVFYIVRPIRLLFGGSWKQHTRELKFMDSSKQKETEKLLNYLGL